MDLESLNQEYIALKASLKDVTKQIEVIGITIDDLADDKIINQSKQIIARRNKDVVAEEEAKEEMKKIEENIKILEKDLLEKKAELEEIQIKINSSVNLLINNDEMKEHINEIVAKKYFRRLKKLDIDREKVINKKEKLIRIQELVIAHPTLGNYLKGIIIAKEEIKNLEKELDSMKVSVGNNVVYQDKERAEKIQKTLIPQLQSKLNKNKKPFMSYINKHKIDIKENDINELLIKGFSPNENKDIDINLIINKRISTLDRKLISYDKIIIYNYIAYKNASKDLKINLNETENCESKKNLDEDKKVKSVGKGQKIEDMQKMEEKIMEEIEAGKEKTFGQSGYSLSSLLTPEELQKLLYDEIPDDEVSDDKILDDEKQDNEISDNRILNQENNEEIITVVKEEKPKWYQFIKRFKLWNEKRKQLKLEKENSLILHINDIESSNNMEENTHNMEGNTQIGNTEKNNLFKENIKIKNVQKEDISDKNMQEENVEEDFIIDEILSEAYPQEVELSEEKVEKDVFEFSEENTLQDDILQENAPQDNMSQENILQSDISKENTASNKRKQFSNSLKYEIVRDIVEKSDNNKLKYAKQETKIKNKIFYDNDNLR